MNQVDRNQELRGYLTHIPLAHLHAKGEACDLEPSQKTEEVYVGMQGRSHSSRQAQSIRAWQQRRRWFKAFLSL